MKPFGVDNRRHCNKTPLSPRCKQDGRNFNNELRHVCRCKETIQLLYSAHNINISTLHWSIRFKSVFLLNYIYMWYFIKVSWLKSVLLKLLWSKGLNKTIAQTKIWLWNFYDYNLLVDNQTYMLLPLLFWFHISSKDDVLKLVFHQDIGC